MERVKINKYIVADPNICHGKPTFKGTRIMVYLVLEMLGEGSSIEEVLEVYPSLAKEHIKAALGFGAKVVTELVP